MDPSQSGHGMVFVADPTQRPHFAELYDAYFTFVWRNLRYFGVSDEARPDLAQEVWLVVHRRIDSLIDPQDARKWIWGIVRRVVQQHRRTHRRAARRIAAVQATALSNRTEPSGESRAIARDTVSRVIAELPEDQREVLMLACHGGPTIVVA